MLKDHPLKHSKYSYGDASYQQAGKLRNKLESTKAVNLSETSAGSPRAKLNVLVIRTSVWSS